MNGCGRKSSWPGGTVKKQHTSVRTAGVRFEPITASRTQVRNITVFQILSNLLFICYPNIRSDRVLVSERILKQRINKNWSKSERQFGRRYWRTGGCHKTKRDILQCFVNIWPPLWLQIQRFRVRFPALPDFLRSDGSGTGSTHPREDKWRATWVEK
jgi:hypothetical protein